MPPFSQVYTRSTVISKHFLWPLPTTASSTTKKNLKNCLIYGVGAGVGQGAFIAAIRWSIGRKFGESVAYICLMIHPALFTLLMLCLIVTMLIKKALNGKDPESFGSTASSVPANFLNSIIAVSIVNHIAEFIFVVIVLAGYLKASVAKQVARQVIYCVSILANFFIYLLFSRKFRVTLKRLLLKIGSRG